MKAETILPMQAKGENLPGPLYTAVGHALSDWELLQTELSVIFVALCDVRNPAALLRAFGAGMVVHPKLEMLEHAAAAALQKHPKLAKRAKGFIDEVRGFNERRNDIAHGIVVNFISEESPKGFYLVPSWTTTKKQKLGVPVGHKYMWTASQVKEYAAEFDRLFKEGGQLRDDIAAALGSP
jgi:hypothetical protein